MNHRKRPHFYYICKIHEFFGAPERKKNLQKIPILNTKENQIHGVPSVCLSDKFTRTNDIRDDLINSIDRNPYCVLCSSFRLYLQEGKYHSSKH